MSRWVQRFAPELEKRVRRHLRPCRGPWHVDETYVRVGGRWRYLYRAVDGTGRTIDFLLSATRGKKAAKRFLRKTLASENTRHPRTIVTDRLKSYPGAIREMKREGELWRFTRHRRGRWLTNPVEQDHRCIKRRTGPMLGFQGFWTARRTLAGVEAMAMLARDKSASCPPTTGRRSGPSSTGSSASPPERKAAGRSSPTVSQRNGTKWPGTAPDRAPAPGRLFRRRNLRRLDRGRRAALRRPDGRGRRGGPA